MTCNQPHLIPISNTVIKTCPCYENYWIQLKKVSFEVVEFGYRVMLFHFCINCLHEIISSIPFRIIEFEMQRGFIQCIFKIKHNVIPVSHCCRPCMNFVIHRYSGCFFKTV